VTLSNSDKTMTGNGWAVTIGGGAAAKNTFTACP
jgi:hypothetical protein